MAEAAQADGTATQALEDRILESDSLREAVMHSMDAAAQCWDDPTKAGEFHPACAAAVGEALLSWIDERHPGLAGV